MTPTIINNQQLLECVKGYIDKESSTKEEVFVSGLTSDFANAWFKDVKYMALQITQFLQTFVLGQIMMIRVALVIPVNRQQNHNIEFPK